MRIVCPSCSAAYDVPDSLLTAGRVVRCARCGGEWSPITEVIAEEDRETPSTPMAASPQADYPVLVASAPQRFGSRESAPTPRQSAMDWLAAHPVMMRSRWSLRVAWVASVLLLVTAIWGAYAWRSQIMEAWPPSTRAYTAFGLEPG